ncbi:hypothetical protein OH77DRAFT_1431610 [Trametes cingulata]|nr:hypothetical protein OH77DRAFT_1431610 [Trametes cingulata]
MSSDNPPWFVTDPQTGDIIILEVPERLASHPDLQRRGIVLAYPVKLVSAMSSDVERQDASTICFRASYT